MCIAHPGGPSGRLCARSRVFHYVRFRPGYPAEVAEVLRRECRLPDEALIADIGCGTGLLARTLLEAGFRVIGVEPNREMRDAGDEMLRGYSRFRSVAGSAEATTLDKTSCDLVVAGQAFHWFDVERTRAEWRRILKAGCCAALIWNERWPGTPLMRAVEDVIGRFANDADRSIREGGRDRIAGFFAPADVKLAEIPNHQNFDFEGLLGRVYSCSYLPAEEDPRSKAMAGELREVFAKYQRGGTIRFEYKTQVYWGRLT
jgi:SAM-dependent methyltransferase